MAAAAETFSKIIKQKECVLFRTGTSILRNSLAVTRITSSGQGRRNFHLHRLNRSIALIEKDKGYWKVMTGVCLERLPVITPDLCELEKRYKTLQDHYEFVNSKLSNYEVERYKIQERWKAKDKTDEEELELIRLDELQKEKEEEDEEEMRNFQFGSRITKADKENDQKSLLRKLDQSLILLVKGTSGCWKVPEEELLGNETLRQAVERCLDDLCGGASKYRIPSNAPSGVFLDTKSHPLKSKVFFHKTRLQDTKSISLHDRYEDFVWVTKDELKDFVSHDYMKALSKCLY